MHHLDLALVTALRPDTDRNDSPQSFTTICNSYGPIRQMALPQPRPKITFFTASFTLFSFLGRQLKIVVDNQNIHVDCPADNLHFEPYFQPCIESIDPLFPYHVIVIKKYYCT